MTDTPIRDAATVIVLRDRETAPAVLMGQRGHKAAFMPSKFVFPGGALDAGDAGVPLVGRPDDACMERLRAKANPDLAEPLLLAAIREVWEETGLRLSTKGDLSPDQLPDDWKGFVNAGQVPSAEGLSFVFRAITPPGRPRRFDARFFLADADRLQGDIDDFSNASDELSHLQWIPLDKARGFDLPFITEVVLAEVERRLENGPDPAGVPFFHHDNGRSYFLRL